MAPDLERFKRDLSRRRLVSSHHSSNASQASHASYPTRGKVKIEALDVCLLSNEGRSEGVFSGRWIRDPLLVSWIVGGIYWVTALRKTGHQEEEG